MLKTILTKDNYIKVTEIYFFIYILLQPILDLTSFIGSSISEIVRASTMIIGFLYVLARLRGYKIAKLSSIYLIILGTFMFMHFIINYSIKEPYSMSSEIIYIVKTTYFVVMLLVYSILFYSLNKKDMWKTKIQKYIFLCLNIIAIVMVLASITETGRKSYQSLSKEGHSGWFFSANDLSTLLAISAGVGLLYILNQKRLRNSLYFAPFFILISLAMLTIGTKVGIGALLIILGVSVVWAIIEGLFYSRGWKNLITIITITLSLSVIIPFTPAAKNLTLFNFEVTDNKSETKPQKEETITSPGGNEIEGEDDNPDDKEKINVLSGRGDYLDVKISQYKSAPTVQKIFGMGYGGNYENSPKQTEMDLFDYFFTYGILGFILLLLPIVTYSIMIVIKLFKRGFKLLNFELILSGVGVYLGFAVAFIAGHVLTSPASSIYLAIVFSYLLITVTNSNSAVKSLQ